MLMIMYCLVEGSEYQLEERGGARTTLVVGVDRGGRPVCRLTSLESHHSDLQHRASSQDSADEEDHLSVSVLPHLTSLVTNPIKSLSTLSMSKGNQRIP
jgi:hypothetical protein